MLSVFLSFLYIGITTFLLGFGVRVFTKKYLGYEIREITSLLYAGLGVATVYSGIFSLFAGVSAMANIIMMIGCVTIAIVFRRELAEFRHRYKIEDDDFCIGICARLESYKGHDVFLRAAKLVLEKNTEIPFRFLIVGTGSQEEVLKEEAQTLGIAERVRFLGFVEDMAPVYRLLCINVNCSRATETSCLALSEGMSAGVPFIASDFGGNVAMVGESEAGFLFTMDDEAALAEAILRIATDRDLEERMRAAARARYEEKYTAEQMGRHLTAVYEQLYRAKCEEQAMRL